VDLSGILSLGGRNVVLHLEFKAFNARAILYAGAEAHRIGRVVDDWSNPSGGEMSRRIGHSPPSCVSFEQQANSCRASLPPDDAQP
jgi:hypothetical protein